MIGDNDILLIDATELSEKDIKEIELFLVNYKVKWKWVEGWQNPLE